MLDLLLGYVVGLLHGVRHALEPDHVAAVSTMVVEQRTMRGTVRFAMLWGLGHALTLLAIGSMLFAFRTQMPPRVADGFELLVAAMLVVLGMRAIVAAREARAPHDEHVHDGHGGPSTHGAWPSARRPLVVGLLHGLAGSGALAAMVMAELPTLIAAVIFITLYGLGALCGMAALAGLAGPLLARLTRTPHLVAALMFVTGVVSIGLGVFWGYAPLHGLLHAN